MSLAQQIRCEWLLVLGLDPRHLRCWNRDLLQGSDVKSLSSETEGTCRTVSLLLIQLLNIKKAYNKVKLEQLGRSTHQCIFITTTKQILTVNKQKDASQISWYVHPYTGKVTEQVLRDLKKLHIKQTGHIYRMVREKPAHRLVDQRGRTSRTLYRKLNKCKCKVLIG